MADIVIENPVLNSPFEEPTRHFRFSEDGITDEVVNERRTSAYFIPIPPPKKKGRQLAFDTEWAKDRIQENTFINQVRSRVAIWRRGGYQGVTNPGADNTCGSAAGIGEAEAPHAPVRQRWLGQAPPPA